MRSGGLLSLYSVLNKINAAHIITLRFFKKPFYKLKNSSRNCKITELYGIYLLDLI
jgi:hypothetical protein